MKSISFFCIILLILSFHPMVSAQSIAEKLAYSKADKLLIIHADDMASAHSENQATFDAFEKGMVNSSSIMVPCAWLPEAAEYARNHPEADLGLHLTVTSEWQTYKWGPVAPKDQVPSLLDSLGYFYDNCGDFANNAKLEEVEIELRAQIELALAMGIRPTHFDSHMGCLFFQSPELFGLYVQLGREYEVPVLLEKGLLEVLGKDYTQYCKKDDVIIDKVMSAGPEQFDDNQMAEYYAEKLKTLPPGLHEMIIHLAYDEAEMQAITKGHPHWGANWRQQDYDFFTSEECRKILKDQNIKLVTWREIQKVMYGK